MRLQITASSTALFSTWIFVENLGLLFDAGDGVSACLGQKGRKIRNIFVTHADRDHVCGLLQLHQLNASAGFPKIHYPADCGSFPALREFVSRFDPQSGPASWIGLGGSDSVDLENGFSVVARTSSHISSGNLIKALDFTLCTTRRTLKAEYRGLSGAEIALKRQELGEMAITETKVEKLLGYSGDAPELDANRWSGVKVLIHEATFLESDTARRSHANLPQVIAAAAKLNLEALILLHFSARYQILEIKRAICNHAGESSIGFPIFAVFPGHVMTDILATEPVWKPTQVEKDG